MQVDFGQTQERDQNGYLVKLWFITFVLSCSRYKYVLWQEECLAWLDRAANGKRQETTKKIPHEVFRQEQTYSFESNRYSVPLGTYNGQHPEVGLRIAGHELIICDNYTGEEIARHERCMDKGQLIQNNHHRRDRSKGIDAYLEHVAKIFPESDKARDYLEAIRTHKPRYIRISYNSF